MKKNERENNRKIELISMIRIHTVYEYLPEYLFITDLLPICFKRFKDYNKRSKDLLPIQIV